MNKVILHITQIPARKLHRNIVLAAISMFTITLADAQTLSIKSNFNGTPILGNRFLWFNSHVHISNHNANTVLYYNGANITFDANGITYNLAVPKSKIMYVPPSQLNNQDAVYKFDQSTNTWLITVSQNYNGDVFLSGMSFPVPDNGLPAGINPIDWSGNFSTNSNGVSILWQWSAAVYTNFATDYNDLKVDVTGDSLHIGAPMAFTGYVVGGARGGGGSNWTGSWSATKGFSVPQVTYSRIGRFVFNDKNKNGKKDAGDTTIPNVTVRLYDINNNFVAQAITDSTGYYLIDSIPVVSGDFFKMQFIKPPTYSFVTPNAPGSDSTTASIADPTTGLTPLFLLNRNQDKFTVNAGMIDVGAIFSPLAVNFGPLNIALNNQNNPLLKWETYSESGIDKFQIERSADGNHFTALANVNAAGNSTSINKYQFTDASAPMGENYYRIKIIGKDLNSTYSKIVAVKINSEPTVIKDFAVTAVSPNPFVDKVSVLLQTTTAAQVTVNVFDYSGKALKTQTQNVQSGTNQIVIKDLAQFNRGNYLVVVKANNQTLTTKIQK